MFDWIKKLDPETRGLAAISSKFEQMLEDGRHVFDAAANALLGGTDVEVIREDLFATDRRINKTEQEIRRSLVVHGSVHGQFGSSGLLVMMSLVKDAERVGDYGKNIFDLAAINGDRIRDPERQNLIAMKDEISNLLVRSRNIYSSNDEAGARQFLKDSDVLQDRCDDALTGLIREDSGRNNAATVLCYRYFKRIISHVGNIATSLVMPLDKLDFFDEPKERPRGS